MCERLEIGLALCLSIMRKMHKCEKHLQVEQIKVSDCTCVITLWPIVDLLPQLSNLILLGPDLLLGPGTVVSQLLLSSREICSEVT